MKKCPYNIFLFKQLKTRWMDVVKELGVCRIQNLIKEGNIIKNYISTTKKQKKEAVAFLVKELELKSPYYVMLRLFFANIDKVPKVLRLYRKDIITFSDMRYLGCCSKAKQAAFIAKKQKKRKCPSSANAHLRNAERIVEEMNRVLGNYNTLHSIEVYEKYKAPTKLLDIRRAPRGRKRGPPYHGHTTTSKKKNYYEDLKMEITNPEHEANYEEYKRIEES